MSQLLAPPYRHDLTLKTFLLAISSALIVWIPVLLLHLTLVLFSALIMYAATKAIANWLRQHVGAYLPRFAHLMRLDKRAEWLAILSIVLATVVGIYVFGDWVAEKASIDTFNRLLLQIMQIFDQLHKLLPANISQHLPASVSSFQNTLVTSFKNHVPQLQLMGIHTLRGVSYVVAGAVIGGIMALQIPTLALNDPKPLTRYLSEQFDGLIVGFSNVFFAQVKISGINTILTAIYLLGILPLIGHPLPMAWTVVLITFVAGLFPVVGNLISNIVIVLLSLTHGLGVSVMSLLWLVSIHKLEYFLNAQIIGQKIRASAWELLLFMLLLESLFGIAGLISAPIIYAQIKQILIKKNWV